MPDTYIKRLVLHGFRNHGERAVELTPGINIIVGDNATGKTNIIEALGYLTMGESLRGATPEEATSWGSEKARVSLIAEGDTGEFTLAVTLDSRRTLEMNGKHKRLSDYKGIYPSVLFTPDDLRMIKESSGVRRKMLDDLGSQLSKGYYSIKRDYEKTVQQRNALLKNEAVPPEVLDAWTENLVVLGSRLYRHRMNLFSSLSMRLIEVYEQLNPDTMVSLEYLPSWCRYIANDGRDDMEDVPSETEDAFREAVSRTAEQERIRHQTLVGPHRDEILVKIDGKDARLYGSQGQQRLLTIAWKFAEVRIIEDTVGKTPLLLLDDVMSEFDGARRRMLLSYIDNRIQTVITTTTLDYFTDEILGNANIISFGRNGGEHE